MSENNFDKMPENKLETTISDALNFIESTRSEIAVMGANDSEMDELDKIKSAVESKKISPQEAISKALGIKESKQDYH